MSVGLKAIPEIQPWQSKSSSWQATDLSVYPGRSKSRSTPCLPTESCNRELWNPQNTSICSSRTQSDGLRTAVEPQHDSMNKDAQILASKAWSVRNEIHVDLIDDPMSSVNQDRDLDLFTHCWRRQTCDCCLSTTRPCSWCATSQTCVPNEVFRWPFSILAPIKTENVCPLGWHERWEMRAKPFSCRCSSMTLVSVVVAVFSTLVGVLLLWLLALFVRFLLRTWKQREDGWLRFNHWRPEWTSLPRWPFRSSGADAIIKATATREEQRPLLA